MPPNKGRGGVSVNNNQTAPQRLRQRQVLEEEEEDEEDNKKWKTAVASFQNQITDMWKYGQASVRISDVNPG